MRILIPPFTFLLVLTSCGTNQELSRLKAENARLIEVAEQAILEAKAAQEIALQQRMLAEQATTKAGIAQEEALKSTQKAQEAALQQKILADMMRIELEELKKRCK